MEAAPLNLIDTLVSNNEEPSKQEAFAVRQLLVEPIQQLEGLDAEIGRIEKHLEELRAKRASIKEAVSRYSSVLSPIRRIPADVLREIFLHCREDYRNPSMLASEAPMLLTRICSSWRSVALSSPLLWAKIHIAFTNQDLLPDIADESDNTQRLEDFRFTRLPRARIIETLQLRCDAVEEWLRRSGSCPLSISVYYQEFAYSTANRSGAYASQSNLLRSLFQILASQSNRWQEIELSMPREAYLNLAKAATLSHPCSSLVTLRISYTQENSSWSHSPTIALVAPNITTMSVRVNTDFLEMLSHWKTLTYLSIHSSLSVNEAAALLEKCPQLIHVKISIRMPDWTLDPVPPAETYTIHLPELRTLYIADELMDIPSSDHFYGGIVAPKLTTLSIVSHSSPSRNFDGALASFRRHNSKTPIRGLLLKATQLKKLMLSLDYYSNEEMLEILQSASSITHLAYGLQNPATFWRVPLGRTAADVYTMTRWDFDAVFLANGSTAQAASNTSGVPLLPYLETLEILDMVKVNGLSDSKFLQFITSRMDPSPSMPTALLRKVNARFYNEMKLDIHEAILQYAREKGITKNINVDLRYSKVYIPNSLLATSASAGLKTQSDVWSQDDIDEYSTRLSIANN